MSESGRYFVTDFKTGRKFCVEPIGNDSHVIWGDINPATKKIEGEYGEKYKGRIDEDETIITEENGYKNIVTLQAGESPDSYISKLLRV